MLASAASAPHSTAPSLPDTRGRLAPSPTGNLHLGNAFAFLMAWLSVRSQGGRLVLRMEDIDPDRSRPEYTGGILRDLAWIGLDWDEGPDVGGPCGPYVQSRRLPLYEAILAAFTEKGLVYPCYCTRKDLRTMAAAPHVGDEGVPYPGTCRTLAPSRCAEYERQGRRPALRLSVDASLAFLGSSPLSPCSPSGDGCSPPPPESEAGKILHHPFSLTGFTDRIRGVQNITLAECGGDFALRRSDRVIAYQLAAAADDAAMGITEVVRGNDLISSTPRQILLLRLIRRLIPTVFPPSPGGLPRLPVYAHIPLVYDASGERLAKRHKALELRALREAGIVPGAVAGYLAFLAGLLERPSRIRPQELMTAFRLSSLAGRHPRLPEDALGELARI